MNTAVLSPNAAIPIGLRRRHAFDSSAASKHAAGVVFTAPDGDILLLRRAGTPGVDNYVGHWSLPGGGVEGGETPQQGAARETKEEMGVDVDPASLKVLDQRMTPTGAAFHTFAAQSPDKFWPQLNDEHNGAGWFPLSDLPRPLHPGVESTLTGKLGIAADMKPEEWQGLRDGFLKWIAEEESEPEHAADMAMDRSIGITSDSPLEIAMDRDTVRSKTREGRLVVKKTNISKANVCPYRGQEIPRWEQLGLDPQQIYNLLRDPDELRKAAPTSNGVQLLIKHTPVKPTDPHQDKTVGSLGTDAEFDGVFLTNSLFVNVQEAIDGIETDRIRELSPGYHYVADMTPGNFHGTAFDGVMRNIEFNHVCLVEDGRTGSDVLVADEALKETNMAKSSRFAALVLNTTAAHLAPLMAMDSAVTLPKDSFAKLTSKNFKANKADLLKTVRASVTGKLRPGLALDASMQGLAKAIDAFEELEKGIDEEVTDPKDLDVAAKIVPIKDPDDPAKTAYDAEPLKGFLRDCGMDEDKITKCMDMMPKNGLAGDSDETPEEKAERERKEAELAAAKDAEMKDMVSKPAMDAALKAQETSFQKQIKAVRDQERGVRVALAEVHPWTGDLPGTMAFDSAADVYRHALVMKGVDGAKDLHPDALLPILKTLPRPGSRVVEQDRGTAIAMDTSGFEKAKASAPGLEHITLID